MEGRKYDDGKAPHALVDPRMVEGLAGVLAMGAEKYDPYNWAKGMVWSSSPRSCHLQPDVHLSLLS
jgi:hypothetical protein